MIHDCEELPSKLIWLSNAADITVTDLEGLVLGNYSLTEMVVLKTFVLPRASCTFIPSHMNVPPGAVIVQVCSLEKKLTLRISSVSDDGSVSNIINLDVLEVQVRTELYWFSFVTQMASRMR
jgi:hypothetical protein